MIHFDHDTPFDPPSLIHLSDDEDQGEAHVDRGHRLPHTSRMLMQHAVGWSEVMAEAYLREEHGHGRGTNLHLRNTLTPQHT